MTADNEERTVIIMWLLLPWPSLVLMMATTRKRRSPLKEMTISFLKVKEENESKSEMKIRN